MQELSASDITELKDRLVRFDEKIDKLSNAMILIARAEERIVGIEKDLKELTHYIQTNTAKMEIMEEKLSRIDSSERIIEHMTEQHRLATERSLKNQGERMGALEASVRESDRITRFINRAFWIVSTGVIAYATTQFLNIL
jgi:small-conductance mechanosensitive channel